MDDREVSYKNHKVIK